MSTRHFSPDRLTVLAVAAVLVLGGGVVAGSSKLSSSTEAELATVTSSASTTSLATTTTSRPSTSTTTSLAPRPTTTGGPFVEPAPQPVPPPIDEYAEEPHVVLGTIEIPKLGLNVPLNHGISLVSIDRGPSHWPGTALPGSRGNVVVAGHRVTKTRPFRHIDKLVPGDEVIFTVMGDRWVYRVTGSEIVTPDALRIVQQTAEATATLFACHPPGSARYRYVVRLALNGPTAPSAASA